MKNIEKRNAVILFNLGGPDKIESVKPFLFNLFNDKAIISLPQPFRFFLAKFISSRREKKAQNIYQQINGKSPLLDITLSQADSLERELSFSGNYKVFTIMRYWHPLAKDVVKKVAEYAPHQIVLLPLYPQFSSTTSASSIEDFLKNYDSQKHQNVKIKTICCYPTNADFAIAHALQINQILEQIPSQELTNLRLLFSAHGLPQKVIDRGDPYAFQVEQTTKTILKTLKEIRKQNGDMEDFDFKICYQSKVGPLQWTSPSLEQEITRVALDKKIPLIIPVAFVSDHSETLVELDIEFLHFAQKIGIKNYYRVPALNINRNFIQALKNIVKNAVENDENFMFSSENSLRICPKKFKLCPNLNQCQH